MTEHALERLAERAPRITPRAAMSEILSALHGNKAYGVVQTVSGALIYEVMLSTGQAVFPVVINGDVIKTVLTEGMSTETPTGRMILRRRGLEVGIHSLPADAYHADPAGEPSLSSSIGRILITQSPLHAWTASPRLNPYWEPKESREFDIGTAAHAEILGRGQPAVAYPESVLASNGAASTKAAKEFAKQSRDAGLIPLKAEQVDAIGAMAEKLRTKLDELGVTLDPERSEIAALARIDDVMCRCMVDNAPLAHSEPLWDFKTTTDASPNAIIKAVMNYGYDFQAGHYLETWKAATGEDRIFNFIFQEKTPPYEVGVVRLGFESTEMARKKTARAREIWRNCIGSDYWPGYPPGIHQIELPAFYHERWLEQESLAAQHQKDHGRDILDAAARWQAPGGIAAE